MLQEGHWMHARGPGEQTIQTENGTRKPVCVRAASANPEKQQHPHSFLVEPPFSLWIILAWDQEGERQHCLGRISPICKEHHLLSWYIKGMTHVWLFSHCSLGSYGNSNSCKNKLIDWLIFIFWKARKVS